MAKKDSSKTGNNTASSNLSSDPRPYHELSLKDQLQHVQQAHGPHKCNLILNSKKPEIIVPRLHPQELYLTINELGAEDSLDLIALASAEQLTLILDLDCWEGDTLNPDISLNWLEFLLHCGDEKICQLAREMDHEMLALMLKKHLTIIRGIEAYDDDDAENAKRMESIYDIDYRSEDAAKIIGALIKVWQELEQNNFLQIMETLRNEQLTSLEEEVLQQRNARLLDFGILPAHEAKAIYTYLDPASFTTGEKNGFYLEAETLQSPMALLTTATPPDLLAAVLEDGIPHETACELLHLINRKLSADHIDIGSSHALKECLQSTYDTLNLALDYLADKDLETATGILDNTYVQRLFQLGHSLPANHLKQAHRLRQSKASRYFDEPENLFLDALRQRPPRHYFETNDQIPPTIQPITNMRQLNQIEQRLHQIEALTELFNKLFASSFPEEILEQFESYGLSGMLMTAVANQLVNDQFSLDPIHHEKLPLLQQKTMLNGNLELSFHHQTEQFIVNHDTDCACFAAYCLNRWRDFFHGFDLHSNLVTVPFLLLNKTLK